jgi:general nucleoside transport system ATP-binding protein
MEHMSTMSKAGQGGIRLAGICKRFGRIEANREISLDIEPGRILALLGENGAGKSTLMSILAGQLQPDSGTILVDGRPVAFHSTQQAIEAGIGMVYQHFKLVEAMTVAENVLLGAADAPFWLRKRGIEAQVRRLAADYGMTVDPGAQVDQLSMGEKQQVEILKLLHRRSSILIFDEPTAVLTPQEAEVLFTTMQRMAAQGKAVVFISHKLEEVMAIADRIAILRQGRIVDQVDKSEVASTADLARRMVGRDVLLRIEREPLEPRQIVLRTQGLTGGGLQDIHLELRQGEILALVGVAGNGQKQLVETICGLRSPLEGEVILLGEPWQRFFAHRPWQAALSYVPEDRQGLATCQGLDLLDNFLLTTAPGFRRGPWLHRQAARAKAAHLLIEFDIRPPDLDALAWQLSGGNLQKMVLAREFYRKPRLIVAEQPTQGLDIAAAGDIWQLLLKAREQAGILLVTGDLAEAMALADRLAVMYNGRIVATFRADDAAQVEQIGDYMAGLGC